MKWKIQAEVRENFILKNQFPPELTAKEIAKSGIILYYFSRGVKLGFDLINYSEGLIGKIGYSTRFSIDDYPIIKSSPLAGIKILSCSGIKYLYYYIA